MVNYCLFAVAFDKKYANSLDISRVFKMGNKKRTQDTTKFLLSFLESLGGGGEENRTPVRRFRPMIFSERSLSF